MDLGVEDEQLFVAAPAQTVHQQRDALFLLLRLRGMVEQCGHEEVSELLWSSLPLHLDTGLTVDAEPDGELARRDREQRLPVAGQSAS